LSNVIHVTFGIAQKYLVFFENIHAALVTLTQLVSCFTGPNALKSWLDFDKT